MNEERTGKCLPEVEHIRGHLWHRYSIAVNQVMVATVFFFICWSVNCFFLLEGKLLYLLESKLLYLLESKLFYLLESKLFYFFWLIYVHISSDIC